ncbi:Autophagy-related protein [Lachnellula hyalina]|uniref:Autophagy-related protein n=1 Tax=Lachnellula hyalina TaxID=1316788 RepID=A0A8H8QV19_9HELO|nr:Autophagy-related protein [Lachnellula hyalina]TVY22670.1 Autophagy-related protein [Lachnellula hyalina]
MADSVDRVFVHALNTVKKIPKTGASRPPPSDRLRLYGLYKQAMEGDVDGVMERPVSEEDGGPKGDELKRERDKYDAWDAQRGISRTEAKRRYIEALIETMHRYASTTADARELVAELEFVWDQIKNNSASSSGSSPGRRVPSYTTQTRQFQQPLSGGDGPMRVLSPMSEAERESEERRLGYNDAYEEDDDEYNDGEKKDEKKNEKTGRWRKTVEQALVKMTAEIAALREQIATGREYQGKKRKSFGRWVAWFLWLAIRHVTIDMVVLGIVLLWLRKRKDSRVEDLVRAGLKIGREYARKILPPRIRGNIAHIDPSIT